MPGVGAPDAPSGAAPTGVRRGVGTTGGATSRTSDAVAPAIVPSAVGRRRLVLLVTGLLYLFGVVMVASASSGSELLQGGDQWYFLRRQVVFGMLGGLFMLVAMRMPVRAMQRLARPGIFVAAALLLIVFIPGLGHSANGATRWIALPGGFQMQPSEVVKLAVIAYLADHLSRSVPPQHWWRDFVQSPGGVALGFSAVVFIQRDLGSAMVIASVVIAMYMLNGTRWRLLARTVGPGMALVAIGILSEPFRRERFLAFLNPWAEPTGPGYQLVQALVAIGSGGLFGVGLGHSVQKIHFLPEAHTDMIFAIVAEELGMVGVLFVLLCFSALAIVGSRIALRARTRFESLMAAGITATLCGQALLNLSGVTGVMPLTGVPLPLVSYGGSSLVIGMAMLGLLANIAVSGQSADGDGPA